MAAPISRTHGHLYRFKPRHLTICRFVPDDEYGCTLFDLTPEETLRAVTCHAAQALGYPANRGQIAEGYDADLAIWNIEHPAELSYQVGVSRLHARIVNGELSYES